MKKFNDAVDKLSNKLHLSITPVPGFVVGLSGTDSIVAFELMARALSRHGNDKRLVGVHFAKANRKKPTWFEEHIIPVMKNRWPFYDVRVIGLKDNCEIDRFAAIQHISKDEGLWTAWPVNATEKRLGKYTILAHAASIWPIEKFWKSEILEVCKWLNIPEIATEMSRLPDCLCGRDELAAENIEIIDDILRFRDIDIDNIGVEKYKTLVAWIKDQKAEFGFKERTPYTL